MHDQLPKELTEKKCQERMHFVLNKGSTDFNKLKMKFKYGKLYINRVAYKKPFSAPQASDMIEFTPEQVQAANAVKLHKGGERFKLHWIWV